ncbi:hypothetical protein [Streptosporangium sp. NPDC002524]|uniref:hypothetical protein n=1 Tax=Streptosporangium sp. NPDC002524 TaxID=3154537 RepID=UPI00332FC253
MPDVGSRIITALEAAWADIQNKHSEVPDVVMITGPSAQRGGDVWGYHWAERWTLTDGSGRVPELFLAGELLHHGGRRTLETMLHEAAHALAAVRKIKDTSRSGKRYHNGRFRNLAVELGLTAPAEPTKDRGYSNCRLGDGTAMVYADTIAALDAAAAVAHLPDIDIVIAEIASGKRDGTLGTVSGGDGDEGGGEVVGAVELGEVTPPKPPQKPHRSGQRYGVECGCIPPRKLQLTPKVIDDGPVLCGVCEKPFAVCEEAV